MQVILVLEVPDAFLEDASLNAELDQNRGQTPIAMPQHSAVRSLIEDSSPVKIKVRRVAIGTPEKIIEVDY